VTPYDAAYVALAEALGCVLVTGDERLSKAPGVRCAVEVLRAG
jgi:predicted nucleic acid-binding protein